MYCKAILANSLHMSGTTTESGGKNDSSAHLIQVKLGILLHYSMKICVLLHTKLFLILLNVSEVLLFTNGPRIHQVLKEELSREKDMI